MSATTVSATLIVADSVESYIHNTFKRASPDGSGVAIEITTSSPDIPQGSHIILIRCMSTWDDCGVYSGVVRAQSDIAEDRAIIFKFGWNTFLDEEISRLTALEDLQGDIIPRAIGYGSTQFGTSIVGSAFVIFEPFGDYVDCSLDLLSREEK
jgi:hypothetical protein